MSFCSVEERREFRDPLEIRAAQRFGVQRPATALTGPDPADTVCRQIATIVNSTELLVVRCNALFGRDSLRS
jgi:hypothetical protein